MAKIIGCVILDHCVIEDGCVLFVTIPQHPRDSQLRRAKLDGCILGGSTKVGAKAELSKCVTQAGFEVDAGGECPHTSWKPFADTHRADLYLGNYRNAKLEMSDWTTAGAYDNEESDEDEESEAESDDE